MRGPTRRARRHDGREQDRDYIDAGTRRDLRPAVQSPTTDRGLNA